MAELIRRDPVLFAAVAGFILDLIIGDPHSWYHPVQLIGKLISGCERMYRRIAPGTGVEQIPYRDAYLQLKDAYVKLEKENRKVPSRDMAPRTMAALFS